MLKISEKDKILIVRLTALGDCIHTIPLACALKKAYPEIFIGWAVSEKCKDLIINNPSVDRVHIIPKNDSKRYAEELSKIRKEKYTIAIDSQELLKSALVSFSSGAKYRLAHDKSRELAHLFANRKLNPIPIFDTSRHVIERNLDFARYLGIENPQIDFTLPKTTEQTKNYIKNLLSDINPEKKSVVIAPSTTWITKFWTKENWAEVINDINGHVNIIITGSNADKTYINEILKLTKGAKIINLAGETNILELKALFEQTDILITPDSGSAHLASAVKKPAIIALFGATSEIRNGAYGSKNYNIAQNLNCRPCYKKICKYNEGIPECMSGISAQTVIEKIKSIIRNEN